MSTSSTTTVVPNASFPSRIIACSCLFNRWRLASSSRSLRRILAACRCISDAGVSFNRGDGSPPCPLVGEWGLTEEQETRLASRGITADLRRGLDAWKVRRVRSDGLASSLLPTNGSELSGTITQLRSTSSSGYWPGTGVEQNMFGLYMSFSADGLAEACQLDSRVVAGLDDRS